MPDNGVTMATYVKPEVAERIRRLAAETERTPAAIIRLAVTSLLEAEAHIAEAHANKQTFRKDWAARLLRFEDEDLR